MDIISFNNVCTNTLKLFALYVKKQVTLYSNDLLRKERKKNELC